MPKTKSDSATAISPGAYREPQLILKKDGSIDYAKNTLSPYQPTGLESDRLAIIRQNFSEGYSVMMRPRREFNDLTMIERLAVDQMAWSVYQPNDGDSLEGDQLNSWRSNAVRPIVRNKIFSIAGHVTARTLYPKIMASDHDSTEQSDAAEIMSDLIEWSTFNTNSSFADVSLSAVLAALVEPVSIVGTEYVTIYKTVKTKKAGGGWITKQMIDEDISGFQDESIPADQIYVEDFYQADIQKQGWVIRRRIRPHTTMVTRYPRNKYPNMQYVRAGVQVLFNDANQQFYEAYDLTIRQNEDEEVIYHNKRLDLRLVTVNRVMITDPDEPNPREDKLYPYMTFGYEHLRPNGDCFYWKSLAFKTMPDDKIVNTLYPMIIDGSYLAIMPPVILAGDDIIASDVIVPGAVTTIGANSTVNPILVQSQNLQAGFNALQKVEESITESSADSPNPANDLAPNGTAYQIFKAESNAKIEMGPFLQMVGRYVKQAGRLRIGDIKQYMTLPQLAAIEGSANQDLVYRTFVLPHGRARQKSKKISFGNPANMPSEPISKKQHLNMSMDILSKESPTQSLHQVNPILFKNLNYLAMVSPDVVSPMSDELERAFALELWDAAITDPTKGFDMAEMNKMILEHYPMTKRHPEKYLAQQPQQSGPGGPPMPPGGNQPPFLQPPQPNQPPMPQDGSTLPGAPTPGDMQANQPRQMPVRRMKNAASPTMSV